MLVISGITTGEVKFYNAEIDAFLSLFSREALRVTCRIGGCCAGYKAVSTSFYQCDLLTYPDLCAAADVRASPLSPAVQHIVSTTRGEPMVEGRQGGTTVIGCSNKPRVAATCSRSHPHPHLPAGHSQNGFRCWNRKFEKMRHPVMSVGSVERRPTNNPAIRCIE